MEITPELETGEETEEVSSPDDPLEETSEGGTIEEGTSVSLQTEEEFNERVERLVGMMKDDPDVMLRVIAETYVNFAQAEMGIRGMFEAMQSQGIAGLMKGALRRGGRD